MEKKNNYKENNIYKHDFSGIIIIVEENNKYVQRVYTNPLSDKDDKRSGKRYEKLCKLYGLNSNRTNFKPELKKEN
jgi:hypothetical protein